ncbi:MAG: CheR family methyltransferase [Spirulinaceae cyanobacterium]
MTPDQQFLQWLLPQLNLQWSGFRRVRRQALKRITRRMQNLEIRSFEAYQGYIKANPSELEILDRCCFITISRFWRDRVVFDNLRDSAFPQIARLAQHRGDSTLRGWSAACASGEEPYTLNLLWRIDLQPQFPDLEFSLIATEVQSEMLRRAQNACYPVKTIRFTPSHWRDRAFSFTDNQCQVIPAYRQGITWQQQDIRAKMPPGQFHFIFCRNLPFTYFNQALQTEIAHKLKQKLYPGGLLVIGAKEALPETQQSEFNKTSIPGVFFA